MKIEIPELSVVVLIGPSGAGKSTFAASHFLPTQILSSDTFRGWVSDDPNDQSVSKEAFESLRYVASKRLELGRLVVIDATNVNRASRSDWIRLAKEQNCLAVAIVLETDFKTCWNRNSNRPDRNFGRSVLRSQFSALRQSSSKLRQEGFRHVYRVAPEDIQSGLEIQTTPLWNNKKDQLGPFDIIGDLHGCYEELVDLLEKLGYESYQLPSNELWGQECFRHPKNRRAIFVGDLVDRGPNSINCVRLVRNMIEEGHAFCVCGNHDAKVAKWLDGRNVKVGKGLETTIKEFEELNPELQNQFREPLKQFLGSLISHYLFDEGKLVVAHAGLKESFHGRSSGRVREFCLFGDTDGTTDEYGMPTRKNWASEYRGDALVVYGHTPVAYPHWENNTINIDNGCVFGGKLTALRYPELQTVSVPAIKKYFEPGRPIIDPLEEAKKNGGLSSKDFLGKQIVNTRLIPRITVTADQASAAFETINRFTVDPSCLVHLPPTMSPPPSSNVDGFLEHPQDVWKYFSGQGVETVICQKKHMGSRLLALVCKDNETARRRFGLLPDQSGCLYTRSGRQFFKDDRWNQKILSTFQRAMEKSRLWQSLKSDWILLDCELMPWNAKAKDLVQKQYAAVADSGNLAIDLSLQEIGGLLNRKEQLPAEQQILADSLAETYESRLEGIKKFREAYQAYCWEADSIADLQIAPFHILAAENFVADQQNHLWHMKQLETLCQEDSILTPTQWKAVNLSDEGQKRDAENWWLEMVQNQGEGMVTKPLDWIGFHKGKLIQPAIKCRGPEYLRIIYGSDYQLSDNLNRLKKRSTGRKQSLALRQFVLGLESLHHLVNTRSASHIQRCVFAILALDHDPVDPRL